MKICIIGGSGHYRYVIEGLDDSAHLLGIAPGSVDEDLGKLREACSRAKLEPKEYADWRVMLDELHPDIAAINPHFADTATISLHCIERGIHVFSEKPVATEWRDLAALEAALASRPTHFAAMFGIRYQPAFLAAHAAASAGRVGQIRLLQAQKSYRLGTRPAFFSQRKRYGGSISWVGSHAIDWVRWFSGADFLSVNALQSRVGNAGNGELEVSAQCQFSMSEGIMAQISLDYLRPASAPSHEDDRLRVVGTRGVLEVRDGQAFLIEAEQAGVQPLALLPAGAIFADFLRQVRGLGRCLVTQEDSLIVTKACLAAQQSADEGRPYDFTSAVRSM